MIGNQDNYLFLKQTLVVLQACRSGAEMDVNGVQINLPIAINSALERINIIEEEFTVPRFQEFVDATTVNYDHLNEMIILMGSTIEPDSELESLVKETGLPENLYKTVCDLPTCRLLIDEHYTHIEDGTRFPVTSELLMDIAKTLDKAFTWLREWVTAEAAPQPLAQVILVINCIQLADEMIQFGNDRFIGC